MIKELTKAERLTVYEKALTLIERGETEFMCNTLLEIIGINGNVYSPSFSREINDIYKPSFFNRFQKYKTIAELFPEFALFSPNASLPSTWFLISEFGNGYEITKARVTILTFCIVMIKSDLEVSE